MSFGEVSEVAWVWTRSFLDFCETVFTLYGERKADLPPSQQIQSEQIAQTEVLEMGAGNGDDMIRFDGQASLVALRGTLSLELGEVFGSGISYAHCAHCIVPFKPCTSFAPRRGQAHAVGRDGFPGTGPRHCCALHRPARAGSRVAKCS